jgi:hypothetical protein
MRHALSSTVFKVEWADILFLNPFSTSMLAVVQLRFPLPRQTVRMHEWSIYFVWATVN